MSDTPPSAIRRLFGFFWALVVIAYRLVLVLSLVVFGLVLWMALQGGPPIKVEENVALVVAPTGKLVERVDRDPSEALIENLSGEPPSQSALRDVITAFDRAATDKRITLAVLKLDGLTDAGLPQLDD